MTADTVGGVWDYALELAGGLARHDVAVTIATMGRRPAPDQRRDAARLPNLDLVESTFRLEWMDDPWEDVARAGEWLLELSAAVRPDLVHLNGYAHGALPWAAPVVVVGHSCVCSWFEAVRGEPAPDSWDRYRRAAAAGLQAAAAVVAPSRAMLSALKAHYGVIGGRVIPNGRSGPVQPATTKRHFVLCAGRTWDPAKNVAALSFASDRIGWPIYAAGDVCGPDGAPHAPRGLRCLGRLPSADLRSWLAQASVFAAPARYEPFGLSILEAAQAGCALVLGDIPSLRDLWDGAARFVAPDDLEAIASALQGLIEDEASRVELGRRARERAARYDGDAMTRAYLALYSSVIDASPARSGLEVSCAS